MHRIDSATAQAGLFVERSGTSERTRGTVAWWEAVQEEIAGTVEAAGFVLDRTSTVQLRDAMSTLAAAELKALLAIHVDLPAPGPVSIGDKLVVGDLFVVAITSTAQAGETFTGILKGNQSLPKNTSEAIAQGQRVYWDEGAGEVRNAPAEGRRRIGFARDARTAVQTNVPVRLDGNASPANEILVGFEGETSDPQYDPAFLRYYPNTAGTVSITVARLADSPQVGAIEVSFSVDPGSTAVDGVHYQNLTASPVTIPDGVDSVEITFDVIDGTVFRDPATLDLRLDAVDVGTLSVEAARFEAVMEWSARPVPDAQWNQPGPIDHDENAGQLDLVLDLGGPSGSDSFLFVRRGAGSTAVEGVHYTVQTPSPIRVDPGQTVATYSITPINGSLPGDLVLVLELDHEPVQAQRNLLQHSGLALTGEDDFEQIIGANKERRPGVPTNWIGGCSNPTPGFTLTPARDSVVTIPGTTFKATFFRPSDIAKGIGCLKASFSAGIVAAGPTQLIAVDEGDTIIHWGFVHKAGKVEKQSESFRVAIMDRTRQAQEGSPAAASVDYVWNGDTPVVEQTALGGVPLSLDEAMEFATGHPDYLGNGWYPVGLRYVPELKGYGPHLCTWFWYPVSPALGQLPDDREKGHCWWRAQFELNPAGDTATLPNQEVIGMFWKPRGGLIAGAQVTLTVNLRDV